VTERIERGRVLDRDNLAIRQASRVQADSDNAASLWATILPLAW
jgi:hypothetical protein